MSLHCREQNLLKDVGLWWYVEQFPNTLFVLARRAYDGLWLGGIRPSIEECAEQLLTLIREHEPMRSHLQGARYALAMELTISAYLLLLARCVLHSYWYLLERPE